MKSERITIMLETDLVKKLRNIQAKQITKDQKSVSFSKVINNAIHKGIK